MITDQKHRAKPRPRQDKQDKRRSFDKERRTSLVELVAIGLDMAERRAARQIVAAHIKTEGFYGGPITRIELSYARQGA